VTTAAEAKPTRLEQWPRNPQHALIAAVLLWVVPMLVVSVMVALRPLHRSVTWTSYHGSCASWWARKDLYIGPVGMNYLPHFAVLYTPFHFLPLAVGEVLWRLCAAAAVAGGLWRLARRVFPSGAERPFFWATLLAMPLAMNALRNGNANAIFGGVTLLAIVATLEQRWWLATTLIVLATALKPIGIVLMLLAPLWYAPLRWRMLVGWVALAVFPFFFADPSYVAEQYRAAWQNLRACAVVAEHRFADVNGILRTFHTELGQRSSQAVRVLAGALTAGLWVWGARRLPKPWDCVWLYALTTSYLMLFNPMTEANSYGIVSPALGIWAAMFLFRPEAGGSRWIGWCIVAMALTMGLLPNMVRHFFGNRFALFWDPLMMFIFLGLLVIFIARSALLERVGWEGLPPRETPGSAAGAPTTRISPDGTAA
jgi:hypothetical protein